MPKEARSTESPAMLGFTAHVNRKSMPLIFSARCLTSFAVCSFTLDIVSSRTCSWVRPDVKAAARLPRVLLLKAFLAELSPRVDGCAGDSSSSLDHRRSACSRLSLCIDFLKLAST